MEHRGTFVGTPLYASPEMLNNSSSGAFTDLWALGVIVYQIVAGEVPWKGNQEMQIFQQILKRNVEFPNNMPLEAVDLIDKLLQLNPLKRLGFGGANSGINFDALKNHEFFKQLNFKRIKDGLIAPPIPKDLFDTVLDGEQETNEVQLEAV